MIRRLNQRVDKLEAKAPPPLPTKLTPAEQRQQYRLSLNYLAMHWIADAFEGDWSPRRARECPVATGNHALAMIATEAAVALRITWDDPRMALPLDDLVGQCRKQGIELEWFSFSGPEWGRDPFQGMMPSEIYEAIHQAKLRAAKYVQQLPTKLRRAIWEIARAHALREIGYRCERNQIRRVYRYAGRFPAEAPPIEPLLDELERHLPDAPPDCPFTRERCIKSTCCMA